MRTIAAVAFSLLVASSARAQCLGDFDLDGAVEINELITAVGNSLNGCNGEPVGECPIDFSDDNTATGTTDCFYIGGWNPTCGADDLELRWISDGIEDDGEIDLIVIDILGFEPDGLFLAAEVTSPTSAELFAWFMVPDPGVDDLMDATGTVTLGGSGGTLVIDPVDVPDPIFNVDECAFVRYEGTLTDVVGASLRRAASPRLSSALIEHLRARRAAVRLRPNFVRK